MKDPYDLTPLLEPQATIIIQLMDFIPRLQDHYQAMFLDPEPGIYMLNGTEPLLKTGCYYTPSSYAAQQSIAQLDNIKESILDSSGSVVIPQYVMQNKSRFLSATPKVPVRALQTASLLVKIRIQELVQHEWSPIRRHSILAPFKPEYKTKIDYDEIEELCLDLITVVDDFVADKTWHVYFVTTQATDLTIDRAEDFRIIDWTRYKQQEALAEKERRREFKHALGDDYSLELLDPSSFEYSLRASRLR